MSDESMQGSVTSFVLALVMLPYQSDAASAVPDTVILACQDHGAAAVPGWFSCWLPWMAREVNPPALPNRLDR
jgi:hypothetical protein